jgi:hypothetical protein
MQVTVANGVVRLTEAVPSWASRQARYDSALLTLA